MTPINETQLAALRQVESKFSFQLSISIDWPAWVNRSGKRYHRTGKLGFSTRTSLPSAEYSTLGDSRLWLQIDGGIEED